jgi:hypothetical protein
LWCGAKSQSSFSVVRAEGLRIPIRIDGAGRSTGGGPLQPRAHLQTLVEPDLCRPHRSQRQVHEGQHPPIVNQDLWDRVQQSLRQPGTKRTRQSSEALLAGKLFDDRANRMSPTWAKKGSKRWRYYVSQAVLRGDKSKAGSMVRVPAPRLKRWSLIIVAVRSEGRKSSQGKTRLGTFGARHVDTFQLKRRSASYWKGWGEER